MDIREHNENLERSRNSAKNWGWAVYLGGIAVAWAFSLAFFLGAFKGNVFLQVIVTIGVTFVSVNAVVLANGLHHYAVSGWHRYIAIGLYALDLILMLVNVLVSAGELTGNLPSWASAYEPYAYSTVVVPVITWGLLWILDPYHAADVSKQAARDKFVNKVIRQASEFIDTDDGQKIVHEVAKSMAFGQLMDSRALIGEKAKAEAVKNNDTADIPVEIQNQIQAVLERAGMNGNSPILAQEILQMVTNPTSASIKKK